jgi:hypothetical protein
MSTNTTLPRLPQNCSEHCLDLPQHVYTRYSSNNTIKCADLNEDVEGVDDDDSCCRLLLHYQDDVCTYASQIM